MPNVFSIPEFYLNQSQALNFAPLIARTFGLSQKISLKTNKLTQLLSFADKAGGDCDQCGGILDELENIDDDCDRHGITFVKTQDYTIAELYGISEYPVLVYFEENVPNVYEGSLSEEEEVLQWLIQQKTEDRIELITRVMLETMVEETQYLAVYFCKSALVSLSIGQSQITLHAFSNLLLTFPLFKIFTNYKILWGRRHVASHRRFHAFFLI